MKDGRIENECYVHPWQSSLTSCSFTKAMFHPERDRERDGGSEGCHSTASQELVSMETNLSLDPESGNVVCVCVWRLEITGYVYRLLKCKSLSLSPTQTHKNISYIHLSSYMRCLFIYSALVCQYGYISTDFHKFFSALAFTDLTERFL